MKSPAGSIVCYVDSTKKVVFCTQTHVVHDQAMLDQIKEDSFNQGQPLPPSAANYADVLVKWTTNLLSSPNPDSDEVVVDGGGEPTSITVIVPAKADYIVLKDGASELVNGASVEIAADGVATKVISAQAKNGADDTDSNGSGETIQVEAMTSLVEIDKSSGTLDGAGKLDFTLGPETRRGCFMVRVRDSTGNLGARCISIRYT